MSKKILEVKNLKRKFGDFVAVDDISFFLKEGEILGLLGPNGAGKTTTIQMLLGILNISGGSIQYFGQDFPAFREEILERVNFSSTYTNLPWELTVKENLTFISYLYDIKDRKRRLEKILTTFRLKDLENKTLAGLSSGQLTRLNLAKSFINYPSVLLLDEPTASLDPDVAKFIREFLLEQRKEFKVSIIITSHNMAEVEEICDRVIFINHGKIIADDTPENLARSINRVHVKLLVRDGLKRTAAFCEKENLRCQLKGRYSIIDIEESEVDGLLGRLKSQGIQYDEISIDRPNLEDYFMQMSRGRKEAADGLAPLDNIIDD